MKMKFTRGRVGWGVLLALMALGGLAQGAVETYTVPEPRTFWSDKPVSRNTGLVPKAGGFTALFTVRHQGLAPYPEKMGWRNGMIACCRSGYYDGWRVHTWGPADDLHLVFEIGRKQGGVSLEAAETLAANVWYQVAVSWEPSAADAETGTARIHLNGRLVGQATNRPAPLLDGSPLKLGYVDFGVGALKFECAEAAYSDRALSTAEIKKSFQSSAVCRDQKPQDVDPLLAQVVTRAFDLLKQNEQRTVGTAPATRGQQIVLSPKAPEGFAAALRKALAQIAQGEVSTKTIALKPGRYYLDETIELAGSAFDGVSLVAADGRANAVTISGGRPVPRSLFAKPAASALARFPAAVRGKLVCLKADLPDASTPYGYAEDGRRGVLLFADGDHLLSPARWPKGGNYPAVTFTGETFRFNDPSAPKIAPGASFLMHGYWQWFWADGALPVEAQADGSFKFLKKPNTGIGHEPIAAMVGVPEALTEPGEWCYLDGVVYLYPPAGMTSVTVPQAKGPFLSLTEVKGVRLAGLTFAEAVGGALTATKATDLRLEDCRFLRLGGDAARLLDCPQATLARCTFADLGHNALQLSAGDRRTLTAGEALVENCRFTRSGRLQRTYTPAILLEGCGNAVRNCRFENIPSSAMRIEGNDHIVRDSWFRHTVRESDDQGQIDMWGDPTYRGCVFYKNKFHDVGGGGGTNACGRAGIRFDDMISGMAVISNEFVRTAEGHFGAIQIHAGHYNAVLGNTFDAAARGVSITRWGDERWQAMLNSDGIRAKRKVADDNPAFVKRYPEYERLLEDHCRELILDNDYVEVAR